MKALWRHCLVAALACPPAHASLDGSGSIMIIPIVAQTVSYTSEVTVRNPYNDIPLTIQVFYTGAKGTSAAGLQPCEPLTVPPLSTVQFSVGVQCSLPSSGLQSGAIM